MTTLGQPWQWRLAEKFDVYILKPWMEMQGFSRKSSPIAVFESPDVHKVEEGQYWTSLVSAQIQTPQQACDHLGLEYDEAYWQQQEQKEQEQMQKQLDVKQSAQKEARGFANKSGQAPNDAKPEPKAKEVWKVERIREPHNHN